MFCSYVLINTACSRLGLLGIYKSVVKRLCKANSEHTKMRPDVHWGLCISNANFKFSCFKWDQRGSWVFLSHVILCYSTRVSMVLSKQLWIANKLSQSFFRKCVQIWIDLKNEWYMVVLWHMISLVIFLIPSAISSWVLLMLGLPQFSINWSVEINSQKVSSVWFHRLYSLA